MKECFDKHFVKKHNVIYKRACFNRRRQEEGETVDSFVTDLYALAEHCSYGALHNPIGGWSKHGTLSEKLQLDPELTLKKAITQAHHAEAIKLQQPLIQG